MYHQQINLLSKSASHSVGVIHELPLRCDLLMVWAIAINITSIALCQIWDLRIYHDPERGVLSASLEFSDFNAIIIGFIYCSGCCKFCRFESILSS
ncbi:hypothetical protein ACE1CI_25210 [Aerosakkonemataceae cyanobacterium BLCC-F50]|uniref:Uncharacterized protein n=1 Tax=Floridaenema flaviceps BLCC-F50 TaxID=3153642 RepID=A0ABV4XYA9_9CYAN